MRLLYDSFIVLFGIISRVAGLFNPKARRFVSGRKDLLSKISMAFAGNTSPVIWVHCASLGEFEQGRPIIEKCREAYPQHTILLTFFSPSGYEVQKEFNKADFVFYLPLDTVTNARRFIQATRPVLAIFVKYEFWYHFVTELSRRQVPVLSVSAIFRKEQLFFKWYGNFYRTILRSFDHFFVQNDESVRLLQSISITRCTKAGDTRFDRVFQIVSQAEEIPLARNFKGRDQVLVIGSAWPDDMKVLTPFINNKAGSGALKFIIAPHEISESFVSTIIDSLEVTSIRYSAIRDANVPNDARVLIIDNIGMLSRLYRYGEFAFIGGAFGDGLHNILEAACYGVPVFFGNRNYRKFGEATELIDRGGAFAVADYPDLLAQYDAICSPDNYRRARQVTREYVEENLGATETIMNYCATILKQTE
ncbi:MAG TPA: glycosyltransferase N-terminal domain-containing protein [Cyclobacteriaceae bacterium]